MRFLDNVLDRSVVFSFDRTGYQRHARGFNDDHLKDVHGDRHIVITGGNSGIGFSAAMQCAQAGAAVTSIGRNPERTQAAADSIRQHTHGQISWEICDVSELSSVRRLAQRLKPMDVLVHNAGDMIHRLEHTDDGIERITATHVVGPYVLMEALRSDGKLGGQRDARVIFVSSGGMYTQSLSVEGLHRFDKAYDGIRHYALTKRAQVTLADSLDRDADWSPRIRCASMHPGWVDTPALSRAMPTFKRITNAILRTPSQGADTIVWLALTALSNWSSESRFYFDRRPSPAHLNKRTAQGGDAPDLLRTYLKQFL